MTRSLAAVIVVGFALATAIGCSSSSSRTGKGGSGGSGGAGGGTAGAAGGGTAGATGGATGGANAGSGGSGTGGCGGAVCTASQICVHPQCLNCPSQPAPFCVDVPASCGATPTCACFPFTVCQQNGQAGGVCMSIDARGLMCG